MEQMNLKEAITFRLHNQQLSRPQFEKAEEVVKWMGMMQAQDYNQFRWAIGMRMKNPQLEAVKESFSAGRIVRLHLLRCTVQAVTAQDYPWMLDLCRERNLSTIKSWPSYNKTNFSEQYYQEGTEALKEILADGRSLTKKCIGEEMAKLGVPSDIAHLNQILLRGEIEGLLISGEMQGNCATWALTERRFKTLEKFQDKTEQQLSSREALAILARNYFRSHSPACFEDFCWWTGLSITQNRTAIQLIASELEEVKIKKHPKEEQTLFIYKLHSIEDSLAGRNVPASATEENPVILLPPYDEYLIGYKSRWISLDKIHEPKAHNRFGIFHPVILYQGKVVGNWKASVAQKAKCIETDLFSQKREIGIRRLQKAKDALQQFYK